MGVLGHHRFLQAFFACRGGCIGSQPHSRLPHGGRMSSGSAVLYNRWAQAPCRHSPTLLQRGQHAGAGLGTGPHDPSGGQHDAVRCWLGPGSNDPLRCGLNSAHPTFAMRNLLQFAKIPQGMHDAALLLQLGEPTFYPANCVPPPILWRCHGWVGWGTKIFCRLSSPVGEAAFAASCAQGCLTAVA